MRLRFQRIATMGAIGVLASAALFGCGGSGGGGTPSSTPAIGTRASTIRPAAIPNGAPQINPRDVAHYATYGYSAFTVGPGEDQGKKYDLMPVGYHGTDNMAQLASYFSMSDIHVTDKESPSEVLYFGWSASFWQQPVGLFSQAYSPVCLSTTQVLDAAVQTINSLHRQSPFDFGICLGDVANSSQLNELRWFIDVMDGKPITPSSGDHLGAGAIDYQQPFQAAGLDKSIPWYQTIGNHDQYFMGVAFPTAKVRAAQVGSQVLNMGLNALAPNATEDNGVYVGVVDGTTPLGDVIKVGLTADFATPPTVAADAGRLSVSTDSSTTATYINEFFNTSSLPTGHGFNRSNSGTIAACYTFLPKSDIPLKVIVLDDTCKTKSSSGGPTFYGDGWIDQARLTWLTGELQKGQDAGQLMIIACHIPINPQVDLFNASKKPQFYADSLKSDAEMITILQKYPNLILLMAGHRHMNTVTPHPSTDPAHPENGFWEVETPSLRDFPRNFRTFNILRNFDNTISIVTTDVDPVVQPGTPAAKSLGYAIGAYRLFGNTTLTDTTSHIYNAELIKMLTPAMQQKISQYGQIVLGRKAAKASTK